MTEQTINPTRWVLGAQSAIHYSTKEESAVAREKFQIFVNNENVTRHIVKDEADKERVEDSLNISLYGLMSGIIGNWWRIWGNRADPFDLQPWREGMLVPKILMSFDGKRFNLKSKPFSYTSPEVHFNGAEIEDSLSEIQARRFLIDDFLHPLIANLKKAKAAKQLRKRWESIQSSEISDEKYFCLTAGALDLDPYNTNEIEPFTSLIFEAGKIFGKTEKLLEFASAISANLEHSEKSLKWVATKKTSSDLKSQIADLDSLGEKVRENVVSKYDKSLSDIAWAYGYRLAREMRLELCLSPTEKIKDTSSLIKKITSANISHFRSQKSIPSEFSGMSYFGKDAKPHIIVRESHKRGELFTLSRGIGEITIANDYYPSIISGNHNQTGFRQAASRAFASEFIAPIEGIEELEASGKDDEEIEAYYGITDHSLSYRRKNRDSIKKALTTQS